MDDAPDLIGTLIVKVLQSKGLPQYVFQGQNNAAEFPTFYFIVTFNDKKWKSSAYTQDCPDTQPYWKDEFLFDVLTNEDSPLTFELWMVHSSTEVLVGYALLMLSEVEGRGGVVEDWYPLTPPRKGLPGVDAVGSLYVNVNFTKFVETSIVPQPRYVSVSGNDWILVENRKSGPAAPDPHESALSYLSPFFKKRRKEDTAQSWSLHSDVMDNTPLHQTASLSSTDSWTAPPSALCPLAQDMDLDKIDADDIERVMQAAEQAELEEQEQRRRMKEEEAERLFREFMEKESACQSCSTACPSGDNMVISPCEHHFCPACIRMHSQERLDLSEILCPFPGCKSVLPQWALKRVLSAEDFDKHINRPLLELVESNSEMFKCPNSSCSEVMEKVVGSTSTKHVQSASAVKELGPDGRPLTMVAILHRDEHRIRCRACDKDFCSSCFVIPYHLGHTCTEFKNYKASRRCRFCAATLKESNTAPDAFYQPPALKDVCIDCECLRKRGSACEEMRDCGHPCAGIRGEKDHPPCIHPDCRPEDINQDNTEFCNICWVEDLGSAPCIRLHCGHYFHHACVLKKIRGKWPSPQITFHFWDCPLCKKKMQHPSIMGELGPFEKLEEQIKKKAQQRLAFEGLDKDPSITDPAGRFHNRPVDFAMDRFAYYPCFKCGQPYFGGQRRCDAGNQNQAFQAEELVCGGCSGVGQECQLHGRDFIEHKCQYCCSVASWFCWGKTHFCDSCHTRQQRGDYITKYRKDQHPRCPGKAQCPLKLDHPPNGEPFVLGCIICRSHSQV